MWVALEINIVRFLPIIIKSNRKYSTERGIKYFLTQAIASVIILLSLLNISLGGLYSYSLLVAFILKLGAAPLHFWYLAVSAPLEWLDYFLITVLQKVAPFLILSYLPPSSLYLYLGFCVSTALTGALGGITRKNLKKLFIYSSISHTA